ncbi:helix-turn-helix domain-containing protein [Salinispora pacifica]|uniref:helix-turn-helix domain-containing protein n=1 Tax=Salinispora pacifica TaxID=351187 RepID=UPI003B50E376
MPSGNGREYAARKRQPVRLRDLVAAQEHNGRRFARLLRESRTKARLRQEDVVARSGVSLSTIQRWEGGNARAATPNPTKCRPSAACSACPPSQPASRSATCHRPTSNTYPHRPGPKPHRRRGPQRHRRP